MDVKAPNGFSLLELLVTLIAITLLTLWAAPNFQPLILSHQISAQANLLLHGVYVARTTAIEQQVTTLICATSDYITCDNDWNLPLMIFIDANNNQTRDQEEKQLLSIEGRRNNAINRQGPSSAIRFSMTGTTATPATLRLCTQKSEVARSITINLQGRARISSQSVTCKGA